MNLLPLRRAGPAFRVLLAVLLGSALPVAQAQSFCASDGQPRPVALLERFTNADCAACWSDAATPRAGPGELAIDWVVPGEQGDDAPLSAVASRDAVERLQALGIARSTGLWHRKTRVTGQTGALRVAHGVPYGGYLGTSIDLKPVPGQARGQSWTYWLALVETLPAGTEGSPVARNLIRNVLQSTWNGPNKLLKKEQLRFFEARSMRLADGVNPERVRLIGWVEDGRGRVVSAAQSRCAEGG